MHLNKDNRNANKQFNVLVNYVKMKLDLIPITSTIQVSFNVNNEVLYIS